MLQICSLFLLARAFSFNIWQEGKFTVVKASYEELSAASPYELTVVTFGKFTVVRLEN